MNPQLGINLSDADEVVLALNQHTATDPKVIGKNIFQFFFLCLLVCFDLGFRKVKEGSSWV